MDKTKRREIEAKIDVIYEYMTHENLEDYKELKREIELEIEQVKVGAKDFNTQEESLEWRERELDRLNSIISLIYVKDRTS
jgi:hypothetical protein